MEGVRVDWLLGGEDGAWGKTGGILVLGSEEAEVGSNSSNVLELG